VEVLVTVLKVTSLPIGLAKINASAGDSLKVDDVIMEFE
jgi:hypothetical protein